jgi:methyltransferase family protein
MIDSSCVQYGCGFCAPDGWRNFDASPTLRFEQIPVVGRLYSKNKIRFPANVEYGDIVKGLPIAPESCELVYCSHVLEHLALSELRTALSNTYLILKPAGNFRFVMPDLEQIIKRYVDDPSHDAAITFIRTTLLGREGRPRGLKALVAAWLGNSQHLWMWDYKAMEFELHQAGFKQIRRAHIGDSTNVKFRSVEVPERWQSCLGIDCRK